MVTPSEIIEITPSSRSRNPKTSLRRSILTPIGVAVDAMVRALMIMFVVVLAFEPTGRAQDIPVRPAIIAGEETLDLEEIRREQARVERELTVLGEGDTTKHVVLRRQLDALGKAAVLLERLAGLATTAAGHDEKIRSMRAKTEDLRQRTATPTLPDSITDETEPRLNAARGKAALDVTAAETDLGAAQGRRDARKGRLEAIEGETMPLEQRRGEITAALDAAELEATRKDALEAERRFTRLRLATLELEREHHANFMAAAEREVEFGQARLAEARARSDHSAALLAAVRNVRAEALEREKKTKREAAREHENAAERESSPGRRAIHRLEAVILDQESRKTDDEKTKVLLQSRVLAARGRLSRLRRRNENIVGRLPTNERLNKLRREYLLDQKRRIRIRDRELRRAVRRLERAEPELRRDMFDRHDRLVALRDILEEDAIGTFDDMDADELLDAVGTITDDTVKAWMKARGDYDSALSLGDASEVRTEWDKTAPRLLSVVKARIDRIEESVDLLDEWDARLGESRDLLDARERHLDDVSFWLREEPPFSGAELSAAREEIVDTGRRLPKRLAHTAERIAERIGGRSVGLTLGGILVIGAFIGGWLLRRSQARPVFAALRAAVDTGDRALWALRVALTEASPGLLGAAALFVLSILVRWEAPLLEFATLTVAGLAVFRLVMSMVRLALGDDTQGVRPLLPCSRATARRARTFAMIALTMIAIVVPLRVLFARWGYPRLVTLLDLTTVFGGILVTAGVAVRQDVLVLLLPGEERGVFARTVRRVARIAFPLLTIFLVGVLILGLLGYRNAGAEVARRSLVAFAVIVSALFVFRLLRVVVTARLTPQEEPADPNLTATIERVFVPERNQFVRRVVMIALALIVVVGTVVALSAVFEFDRTRWSEIGAFEISSGSGDRGPTTLRDIGIGGLVFVATLVFAGFMRDGLNLGLQTRSLKRGSRYAISTLTFYVLVAIGTVIALHSVGFYLAELGWLLAPAGVALGFGLTEILSNLVSGIILFLERPVQVGDIITIGEVEGDVQAINIRSTVVRTRDGISIILPNKRLITDDVINWSHGDPRTRLNVELSVAYGSDIHLVKRVLMEVAEREGRVMKRPRPEVDFKAFGESELQFRLRVWLATPDITTRRRVLSDVNSAVDATFRRVGIEIPFPQRDLHLRTTPTDHRQDDADDSRSEARATTSSNDSDDADSDRTRITEIVAAARKAKGEKAERTENGSGGSLASETKTETSG